MREIKFRAWDITNKQMFQVHSLGSKWSSEESLMYGDGRFPIMQYTGLHDKNGKEIWEGDIVHTFSRVGRGFRDRGVDKVHYSDITARWYPLDIVVTEMCEVIGDIYSNPELVKEVK